MNRERIDIQWKRLKGRIAHPWNRPAAEGAERRGDGDGALHARGAGVTARGSDAAGIPKVRIEVPLDEWKRRH